MTRAPAAAAGSGFSGPPGNVRDPFSPRLGRTREGIRGGVIARGHRMALPADGRCLRGGRPRRGVPAAGGSFVRPADGVVVGVLAGCPRAPAGRGALGAGRERGGGGWGGRAAGRGGGGRVAVRVVGGGGGADRGHRTLALPDRGKRAFHPSCPAITGMRRQRAWITTSSRTWRC